MSNKQPSTIVAPADKLKEVFADVPGLAQILADNFKRLNPDITCWDDLKLEEAAEMPLDTPKLDTSLQRPLIVSYTDKGRARGLLNIINKFKDSKVAPIRVFRDSENSGEVLAWDGQHTLLTLYFIAVYVLEIDDLSTCMIPVTIHRSTDRAVIREAFLSTNGDDKEGLSPIDHFEQEVYSVEIDGIKSNEKYMLSYRTQRYLEKYGHFLVNKYQDESENYGAITRHNEVTGSKPERTRDFCMYRQALGTRAAPIQPKEQLMMYKYFQLCEDSGIKVGPNYMKRLVKVFKKHFNADWSAESDQQMGEFWSQAKQAYLNWHEYDNKRKPRAEQTRPKFESRDSHGMPFLLDQLKAIGFSGVPEMANKTTPFTVLKKDLWK